MSALSDFGRAKGGREDETEGGRTALNLICATARQQPDRPTMDTENEPAGRRPRPRARKGGREKEALYIRHFLDSDSWQSSDRQCVPCLHLSKNRGPDALDEGHATTPHLGGAPYLRESQTCANLACRSLSLGLYPQRGEKGEDEDIMLLLPSVRPPVAAALNEEWADRRSGNRTKHERVVGHGMKEKEGRTGCDRGVRKLRIAIWPVNLAANFFQFPMQCRTFSSDREGNFLFKEGACRTRKDAGYCDVELYL